jgi:spore coat protein A
MATRRFTKTRRTRERIKPRVELLEDRNLLAAAVPGVTLDPMLVPKFQNTLPADILALGNSGFEYQPTGTANVTLQNGSKAKVPLYNVGAYQIQEDLGLGLKDANGNPIKTTVYGYGTSAATATYPGRSFNVQSGQPIAVQWTDGLTSKTHLLPVDPTVLGPNADSKGKPYYTVSTDPTTGAQNVTFTSGVPIVPHVHGGHTTAAFDGTPQQWFTAGGQVGPDFVSNPFVYDNSQQAGTIWYHDHAMGVTRLNVYAGLAGFYVIHDANENSLIADHTLPAETYDVPLAIQDRMFYAADDPATPQVEVPGQLYYPANVLPGTTASYPSVHPEFFGDTILVDGKAWPVMNVEPRLYRFRVLDGSQSRFYNLQLNAGGTGQNQTFYQIGTDDGLLAAPVALNQLLVAPGERADIVVDFSKLAGQTVIMTNTAKGPFPHGAPSFPDTTGQIMAFKVTKPLNGSVPDANPFARPLNTITPPNTMGVPVRPLGLFETVDSYGRLIQKLGSLPLRSDPTTTPIAPSDFMGPGARPTTVQLMPDPMSPTGMSVTEVWQVYNVTADTHPIHLHSTSFQIVSRQKFNWKVVDPATGAFVVTALTGQPTGPDANENGWKDTVRMNPGEVTTILVKFDLPGNYVWHCHILEHEEHDMMNQLVILAPQH